MWLFEQKYPVSLNYHCKSSGRLAKGIKGKAIHADFYISANKKWMDEMIKSDLVDSSLVNSLWGNTLVVASSKDDPIQFDSWNDLTSEKVKSVMIGDPGTAPFGRYAKQALQATDIWDVVKNKIETRKHITLLADSLKKSSNGTVGILFKTNLNEQLKILYVVDKANHKPIRYYSAPMKESINANYAQHFSNFLNSDDVKKLFSNAGFDVDEN